MAALVGLAWVGLAACGSSEQPTLGAGVAAPTTLATTTTTVVTTTTTTIDFGRPITQGTAPLGVEIGPADVAALAAELRGQTTGFSAQVKRLAPFPDLAVAPVAQIIGINVTLAPEEEGTYRATASVRFRAPDTAEELIKAINDQFVSLAWNPNGQSITETEDGTVTETVFRKPGFAPDEAEVRSFVTAGQGPTQVQIVSVVKAEPDQVTDEDGTSFFERLAAWTDGLSLPRAAELTEVAMTMGDEAGTVSATYLLTADDEGEAITALARAIDAGDYELQGVEEGDEPPSSGPLRLVDEAGNLVVIEVSAGPGEEMFVVVATNEFELDPLD